MIRHLLWLDCMAAASTGVVVLLLAPLVERLVCPARRAAELHRRDQYRLRLLFHFAGDSPATRRSANQAAGSGQRTLGVGMPWHRYDLCPAHDATGALSCARRGCIRRRPGHAGVEMAQAAAGGWRTGRFDSACRGPVTVTGIQAKIRRWLFRPSSALSFSPVKAVLARVLGRVHGLVRHVSAGPGRLQRAAETERRPRSPISAPCSRPDRTAWPAHPEP